MKKTMVFGLSVCFLFLFSPFAQAKSFEKIVIFGDSLSDNGNLHKVSFGIIPKSPPYYEGRFSNGPVWVEKLAENFGMSADDSEHFIDKAVGGAVTVFHVGTQNLPYDLGMEVDGFLLQNIFNEKDKDLYVFWIGANDYLNGADEVNSTTQKVVDKTIAQMERIKDAGGRYFLLLNMPNLGLTPKAKENNSVDNLSLLAKTHNALLEKAINQFKKDNNDVDVNVFDVNTVFEKAIASPQTYQITNVTSPCYDGGYTRLVRKGFRATPSSNEKMNQLLSSFSDKQIKAILNNPSLSAAVKATANTPQNFAFSQSGDKYANCDAYVFWDEVHPTQKVHQILSEKIYQYLVDKGYSYAP